MQHRQGPGALVAPTIAGWSPASRLRSRQQWTGVLPGGRLLALQFPYSGV